MTLPELTADEIARIEAEHPLTIEFDVPDERRSPAAEAAPTLTSDGEGLEAPFCTPSSLGAGTTSDPASTPAAVLLAPRRVLRIAQLEGPYRAPRAHWGTRAFLAAAWVYFAAHVIAWIVR
jgi:hypothetical protein